MFVFRQLCTGEAGPGKVYRKPLHYKGSAFHRVIPQVLIFYTVNINIMLTILHINTTNINSSNVKHGLRFAHLLHDYYLVLFNSSFVGQLLQGED